MERKATIYIITHLDLEVEQTLTGKFDDDEIRKSVSGLLDDIKRQGDDYVERAYVEENGKIIMVANDEGDDLEYADDSTDEQAASHLENLYGININARHAIWRRTSRLAPE